MARANTPRVRDKATGMVTNIQDIVMALSRQLNKGFDFDENWIILDSGAQTSSLYNAKLLKALSPKIRPTQFVGISDAPIYIAHEGYFCDNLQVD
jgi:hypothetical protein